MARGSSTALSRDIRTLFDIGTVVGLSDRQLLDRFAGRRDPSAEAAFEALVLRHGPMVLRVCQNVLHDPNDAQDAFQATFLVLVRRCDALRGLDSLGGWIYGVACRVAARARVDAARRRAVEGRAALRVVEAIEPADAVEREDFGPIMQEEVRRLPEKYRAAVVLCYWEGLTQEQAAAQLGCPLGTVRSRLARARDLLRRRLTRRGAAPFAGAAVPGFDFSSIVPIPATVPDSWVASAVKAVTNIAVGTGPATAGAASASVGALVHSVLRSMLMVKLKTIAIGLSFVGLGAAGVILAAPQAGKDRPAPADGQGRQVAQRQTPRPAPATDASHRKVQPPLHALPSYVIEPPDMLLVEVLEALPGRPISGERLVRPDGKISLGFYGEVYVAGLTVMEAKEKIVLHLRNQIADHILGLTDEGAPNLEGDVPTGKLRNTDRVFVDVTAYNSKNYYIQGAVRIPGRLPVTGSDTVLDAITYAGGLTSQADHDHVVLYRKDKSGTLQRLPVNIDQITMGDDPTTNYQLLPGDRLVVPARPGADPAADEAGSGRPTTTARARSAETRRVDRRPPASRGESPDDADPRHDDEAGPSPTLRDVERRLGEVERKLDRVLDALERRGR